MKQVLTFITTWPASAIGLYAFLGTAVTIRAEQESAYLAGSAFVGFIAAVLATAAVSSR